jgi:predicted metal-dependent hydrolase
MSSPAFWQAIDQFNDQEFYACHDTLEALWLEASETDKNFYQGILQIAVACHHLGNYNWRGAVILLGEGIKRLSDYQPVYEDINVTNLLEDSVRLLKALQQIEPEQITQFVQQLQPPLSTKQHSQEAILHRLPIIVRG